MERRLNGIVRRAAGRLRLLPVVDGVADDVLSVEVDRTRPDAIREAITELAHAVEDERPTALVRLELPQAVEYAGQDRDGRVRVLRMFWAFPKQGDPRMVTMIYAGIRK